MTRWFSLIFCLYGFGLWGPTVHAKAQWDCQVASVANKKGETRPVHLWLPEGGRPVRGLLCAAGRPLDVALVEDPVIRKALTELRMGAIDFLPSVEGEGADPVLAKLATMSQHPEVARVPLFTVGQGGGAVGARNVAYLAPDRTIGVIHIKSGNLHHGIPDPALSLAGVPFLAINGEFEEVGPEGGDLGIGLRTEYAVDPAKASSENQTQWVMLRMQLLDRRRKNPDNLMAMIVHRGGGFENWSDELTAACAQFIRSVARIRLPEELPTGSEPIRCRPVKVSDGWLYDADLKHFQALPARYADYTGNKQRAFWVPDFDMAEWIFNYHGQGWDVPDPTHGLSDGERFAPPYLLSDEVDATAATKRGGK